MRVVFAATVTAALVSLSLLAGVSFGQSERSKDVQPTPRWSDGRVNLASVPGQKGHWIRTRRELVVDADTANILPNDRKVEEIPFQPWAKALFEYRRTKDDRDSPHARCKPSAGPRQIGTAYGFEMVEFPEIQRVIIFDHTQRKRRVELGQTENEDGKEQPATMVCSFRLMSIVLTLCRCIVTSPKKGQ